MNANQEDNYNLVVAKLSRLLSEAYETAASQQRNPHADSDHSDEVIKDALAQAKVLREIRHRFELTMTDVILTENE